MDTKDIGIRIKDIRHTYKIHQVHKGTLESDSGREKDVVQELRTKKKREAVQEIRTKRTLVHESSTAKEEQVLE